MIREVRARTLNGIAVLAALATGLTGVIYAASQLPKGDPRGAIAALATVMMAFALKGLFRVNPNEAKVLQLFGRYVGTVRTPGLRWTNPFYGKTTVSTRVRNFETSKLKVNDEHGNPIEIAAVVVWRVVDTAEALFEVDDFVNYLAVQSEAAVRNLATSYPYDSHDETGEGVSLVGNIEEVSERLREENQARLEKAGIEIIESRISHLAYAPEIAQAMLRRQQASAVIAARRKIVEGAVGMVDHALAELRKHDVVELDEERKATMVSNLLVVLCSETETQPVVNTGSLYT
ncbi:MAG: SPFH domain-containing protein [Myxococcales bacterium]|nr:SPFH domain-containing protein [Myxococcales bacterium]